MAEEEKRQEDQKLDELYLRFLEKHSDLCRTRHEYAIKQFDTLMITLSTAGLGFVSSYIQDSNANSLVLAQISQLTFLFCLLTSLFSHVASMWSNGNAHDLAEINLNIENGMNKDYDEVMVKIEEARKQRKIKVYDTIVRFMNASAFIFLLSGIICFVIFALISSDAPVVSQK